MSSLLDLEPLPIHPEAAVLLRDLERPLESMLLEPARRIGRHDIAVIGVTEIPKQPIIRKTNNGTWFFAAPYLDDPGLARDGAIAIPEVELHRLIALRDAGVRCDLIWIGHEVPADWKPGQPLPDLVPAPANIRRLDANLERLMRGTAIATAGVAAGVALAAGAGVGLALGAAVAPFALIGLDPVILAGVKHPTEPVAAWAPLAAWNWD